ncbi:hypothetical protein HERIO_2147 [Hepatospora eriocheir]|uniref:Aspartyl protease n=1 Tax=Hepatospora eriocheir TaxID=1081669 RepID=A0A1X0Q7X7_9MICR|nr:hypothetical protein HERIO_2147 [Hepatospora eriocheir]
MKNNDKKEDDKGLHVIKKGECKVDEILSNYKINDGEDITAFVDTGAKIPFLVKNMLKKMALK